MQRIISLIKDCNKNNAFTLAASLAFFTTINGGSFFFLILITVETFNINIIDNFITYLPQGEIYDMALYLYHNAMNISKSFSFFFLLTSIWASSSLFVHILRIGDMVYQCDRKKFKYFNRILSFLFLIVFLIILVVAVIVLLIASVVFQKFLFIFSIIAICLIPFLISVFIQYIVYPKKPRFKDLYKGILFSFIYTFIVSIAFMIFLNLFSYKIIYGAFAVIIAVLFWIYLLSQSVLIGMVINKRNVRNY